MAQTHTVDIRNLTYQPTPIAVAAGDSVQWTNLDATQHTVTADDGLFDSGGLETNATFTQAFPQRGTVQYHCDFHPHMTGTVVVN